jgi:8-oxo-dGTP pyrophosphatase MutT (NUDIX family)
MELLSTQVIVAFIFGVVFIVAMLLFSIKFPHPTPFQYNTFRITFSLAAAGVAAMIPGFINLEIDSAIGLLIRAGGAIAVFVLIYFYNPARLTGIDQEISNLREQVAAICYRIEDGVIQFYLVKTTGGRWTFPKGNIEKGEDAWFAAKREAFEEAGVTGDIEHEPITSYLHEKKEWKKSGKEIKVKAFVLKVENTQKPQEENRNPTWFEASEAETALVEDRGFKYAEEFRRVLDVVCKHITKLA